MDHDEEYILVQWSITDAHPAECTSYRDRVVSNLIILPRNLTRYRVELVDFFHGKLWSLHINNTSSVYYRSDCYWCLQVIVILRTKMRDRDW